MKVALFASLRAFDECPRPRKCEAFSRCAYRVLEYCQGAFLRTEIVEMRVSSAITLDLKYSKMKKCVILKSEIYDKCIKAISKNILVIS